MAKLNKPAPAAEPKPESKTPEWAFATPEECDYRLVMYDSGGDSTEEVIVSRKEFIAAKHLIATMRGYNPPPPEEMD